MSELNSAFAQALAKKQQAEKEAENAKSNAGSSFNFEELLYFPLEDYKEKVFRIVGNPHEVRTKGSDAKIILQSKIVSSDKKTSYKINWPVSQKNGKYVPDPDWILTRLYDEVNKRTWVNYTQADVDGVNIKAEGEKIVNSKGYNGYWKYHYDTTKIFNTLTAEGNKRSGDKYPSSVYPSKRVVMNVIGRNDDTCSANNHTQILISKLGISEKENEITGEKIVNKYPDTGIPETLYNKIFKYCIECGSDWFGGDMIVKRASKDKEAGYYHVHDVKDSRFISDESKVIAKEGPLTEEEQKYEMYDLDEKFPVASYNKLLKRLKHLFQMCDAELGTSFLAELETCANIEREEWAKNKKVENEDSSEEETSDNQDIEKELEEMIEKPSRIRKPVETKELTGEDYFKSVFPLWDSIPEVDRTIIKNSFESKDSNGFPVFKKEADPVTCTNSGCVWKDTNIPTETPSTISMCPICGEEFPVPED